MVLLSNCIHRSLVLIRKPQWTRKETIDSGVITCTLSPRPVRSLCEEKIFAILLMLWMLRCNMWWWFCPFDFSFFSHCLSWSFDLERTYESNSNDSILCNLRGIPKGQSVPVCLLLVSWQGSNENVRPVRCIQKLVFETPWTYPQMSHPNESENHHILEIIGIVANYKWLVSWGISQILFKANIEKNASFLVTHAIYHCEQIHMWWQTDLW